MAPLGFTPSKSIWGLFRRPRRVFQRSSWLFQRFLRRKPGLVFFSPRRALSAACQKPTHPSGFSTLKFASGEVRHVDGISIHENVISYPLVSVPIPSQIQSSKSFFDFYYGGLVDSKAHTLIHEANHYRDDAYIQSLPTAHIDKYSIDNCLEIRQPCLYGGILFNHFGHFVSESLSRLYAYPLVRETNPFVLFYPSWGRPDYLDKDNYVNQILAGFGIPVDRIILVDQIAKIKEIVIPTQRYGWGFIHRADEVFTEFVRTFKFTQKFPTGLENGESIYVSRSRLRNSGRQIGDRLFELYLEQEGYKVFYPEDHTIVEQLTVYTCAQRLIFSEGSAVLSCILLPDLKADVAIIGRRRDPVQCMRMTIDCLQGYGKSILWIDAVQGQYQFGLNTSNALADIDWQEVTRLLYEYGFIKHPSPILTDEDRLDQVKHELREYLHEIHENPLFIDYMMRFKETYPRWSGPSHQVDPRNGLPVWPPADPLL